MATLPPIIKLIRLLPGLKQREILYRYSILILTFLFYMSYHMSRKPISIVKGELHRNCSKNGDISVDSIWFTSSSTSIFIAHAPKQNHFHAKQVNTTCDWPPFDKSNYETLFGALDYAFLLTYAIGMFFSGYIGERIPLRFFLGFGMIGSGIFTTMFGMGYFWNIHIFAYFVIAQVFSGLFQTTGWPGVVTAMGRWFGKGNRGLIMGIWNSHTSVGNILGSLIAAAFVNEMWGWSFAVPGIIIGSMGFLCLLVFVEEPSDVNCSSPNADSCENTSYTILPSDDEDLPQSSGRLLDTNLNCGNVQRKNWNSNNQDAKPISFYKALFIPGVVEFSLCLFFSKLVNYTFLFWLPMYIQSSSSLNTRDSGLMSTLFDVGGIVGGITAGVVSDYAKARAATSGCMLVIGAFMMYIYNIFGARSHVTSAALLFITGAFVNGPYALITTAVSADLGTHEVLQGNAKALATVTAIIDGTGSIGAAFGPFLTGLISPTGWKNVFYMLISSNIVALVLLTRLIYHEILSSFRRRRPENQRLVVDNGE